ncbi:hypothetical protein ACP70R_043809 [Stipagrostis hirtigluma subsp. patula]
MAGYRLLLPAGAGPFAVCALCRTEDELSLEHRGCESGKRYLMEPSDLCSLLSA